MGKINIVDVKKNSIAKALGIKKGYSLISVNNLPVDDIIAYKYLLTDEYVELLMENPQGVTEIFEIEKDYDDDLGLVFESQLIAPAKKCRNKCIFCFMEQLPKGMRETLYFKDDDYRLSFLAGNYVTLTNVTEEEIKRIISYNISPINISVHTTDEKLRCMMLNNKNAGIVNRYISMLAKAHITMNAQIVLCPSVNDGKHLDKTINDLIQYYPYMKSISIVPVGLTKYREELFNLKGVDKEYAIGIIKQVEEIQKKCIKSYGSSIIYLADELYVVAGYEIPKYEHYEDFPQIENGVGMIAQHKHEFDKYFKYMVSHIEKYDSINNKKKVSIATGKVAFEYISNLCKKLSCQFGIDISVYAIENHFYGEHITVTGLITGQDIIKQLKGKDLGEYLLICDTMLKYDEDVFLDDVSLEQLEKELNVKVKKVCNNGKEFIKGIMF